MGESTATAIAFSVLQTKPPREGIVYSSPIGVMFAKGNGNWTFPLPDDFKNDNGGVIPNFEVTFNVVLTYTTLEKARSTTCVATLIVANGQARGFPHYIAEAL